MPFTEAENPLAIAETRPFLMQTSRLLNAEQMDVTPLYTSAVQVRQFSNASSIASPAYRNLTGGNLKPGATTFVLWKDPPLEDRIPERGG
ncbi:hypothetical protein [Limnochorda pilosa]|uniref:Uncharacterized protein n=1 Tax=Limnochorda pilosa TaxID=1555112 RepID=A0A0K2SID6_LIMPI|nr:hypothetical protein [Limnochorda pilosa]BAS26891.1 hypothetical protein LIP_1034 [Limnochorda pilosa]